MAVNYATKYLSRMDELLRVQALDVIVPEDRYRATKRRIKLNDMPVYQYENLFGWMCLNYTILACVMATVGVTLNLAL